MKDMHYRFFIVFFINIMHALKEFYMEDKHKRRIRYQGTHPKHFKEKYKEKNPKTYPEIIEHIILKGNTPAGQHRSIMVDEIMQFLDVQKHHIGLDATLGYGGHSKVILEALNHTGHLHALDIDPIESKKTQERLESFGFNQKDFTVHHLNFKDVMLLDIASFDFIIADLGLSSMQIDDPDRGFSFKFDGLLDLRMNPHEGFPASVLIQSLSEDELTGILIDNSDEPYAKEIAKSISLHLRKGLSVSTTKILYQLIKDALKQLPKDKLDETLKKSAQRTFQAIRIEVNKEYDALFDFLESIPKLLKPNGKVAIISFHSGEDRLVKKAFQFYHRQGIYREVDGPIVPSLSEMSKNPRSKSAKLRTAIKQ